MMDDWCYDLAVLFVSICALTIALTIFIRYTSNHRRYNKYVYTGIIPIIKITTCEDLPNPILTNGTEAVENKEINDTKDASSITQEENVNVSGCERRASLTIPNLDDDFEDEEENIVEVASTPLKEDKYDMLVTYPEEDDFVKVESDEAQEDFETFPPGKSLFVNGLSRKYGTSHTVEDPLFPFSESIEDEKSLIRHRCKKRLSE